jgi:hypothetical protein
MKKEINLENLALFAGQMLDSDTLSRMYLFIRTTSYCFKDSDCAKRNLEMFIHAL